jgi:hypothetical protein
MYLVFVHWLLLRITNRLAGKSSYLDSLASVTLQEASAELRMDLTAMLEYTAHSSWQLQPSVEIKAISTN